MKQVAPPNYTQIPNEILDEWMSELSGLQFKIIVAICRKTFGWHKQSDKISISQLESITGASWRRICNALKDIEKEEYISVTHCPGKVSEFSVNISVSGEGTPDKMYMTPLTKGTGDPCTKCPPQKKLTKETTQKKKEGEADAPTPDAPVNGRFKRPTLETLRQYFDEIGVPAGILDAEAKKFMDHFDACGWVVGRDKPMKDWKAAARNWDRRRPKFGGARVVPITGIPLEERIARAKKREEEIWKS